jgi:V/A-type H+-transporting ATPase subunit I
MRLQFIEFFTKFFEGGGEVFKPLRLGLKYFLIKKEKTEEEKC